MQIAAFERASGLTRTTVRYYERCGLLKPASLSRNGSYRQYDDEQVERAKMIRIAQSLGFSIKEILRLLRAWDSGALTIEEQRSELNIKRAEIIEKKNRLIEIELYLDAKLLWLDNGDQGPKPRLGNNVE